MYRTCPSPRRSTYGWRADGNVGFSGFPDMSAKANESLEIVHSPDFWRVAAAARGQDIFPPGEKSGLARLYSKIEPHNRSLVR
jgi:hypothetical protein